MRRGLLACLALLTGCRGCQPPATAPPDAAVVVDARVLEPDAGLDASVRAALLPPEGRVFFGKAKGRDDGVAIEEIFVVRNGSTIRLLLGEEELVATAAPADAGASALKLTTKSILGPIEVVLHDDGTFDGALTYDDGSKTQWEQSPYQPLAGTQLGEAVRLEGFLSKTTRYRLKLGASGDEVDGVARYPTTREELVLRGTVDRQSRHVVIDEIAPGGKVSGRIDAFVMGHVRPKPFASNITLIGSWISPDGARKLELLLRDGFYPDRIAVSGGIFVSAQERYRDDCGIVDERVFPVLDHAPKEATAKFNAALSSLVAIDFGPASDEPPAPNTIHPGATVRVPCPAHPDPERRGQSSGLYTPAKLRDPWVAFDVEHYYQSGSIRGHLWHDCIVADVASGEIVNPAKLLDPTTREALTTKARAMAIAALEDGGAEEERSAASTLEITADSPLCIGEKEVRFAIGGHPVFGPSDPRFERAAFVNMLPPGKLRELFEATPRSADAAP